MQEEGLTWDKKPSQEYWIELFRISKNQIVWGANNFEMPPSEYFCIWNKKQTVDNFASAEYAWVSMGLKNLQKYLIMEYTNITTLPRYIQHKNPLICIGGFYKIMRKKGKQYLIAI